MIKLGLVVSVLLITTMCDAALDCPTGWNEFEGSCYKVLEKIGYLRKFSWSTALNVCYGYGGGLANISNEKEMDFVRNLSSKHRSDPVWIGLAYRFQKGAYLWSNGSSFNSSVSGKWLGELARNVSENRKCVEILGNGWSLTDCCKENKYLICEKAKGALVCPSDWFFSGSSCYKENTKDTWNGAKEGCIESGGNLVEINGSSKHQVLTRFLQISGVKEAKIDYVWIDKTGDSKCIRMKTDTGRMEEGNCEKLQNYVCEKPASISRICYQYPNKNSSVPIKTSCSFPENLCFKFDKKTEDNEQVTVQGCITAEQCRQLDDEHLQCCEGDLCNNIIETTTPASALETTTAASAPENSTVINKVIYISLGVTSAILLLSVAIFVWCYRKRKTTERSSYSQDEITPPDKWQILPEQIEFEEELGRGEFGVVYKATYRKSDEMEALVTETSKWPVSTRKPKAPRLVAVKVIHDNPSEVEKAEFTFEIEQMKLLGAHKNVVSMVGYCTLQEKMFLVIEYVPCGDLLTWLRRRRKKIKELQATERSYADKEVLKDQRETRDHVSKLAKKQIKQAEKVQLSMEMTPLLQDNSKDTASTSYHLGDEESKPAKDRTKRKQRTNENMELISLSEKSINDEVRQDLVSTFQGHRV